MKGIVAQLSLRPLGRRVTGPEAGRGRGRTARAVGVDPRPGRRTEISGRRGLRAQRVPIVPVRRPETAIAIGTAAIIKADPLARHERERQG